MKNAYLLYILLIALLSSCNSYKKPKEECLHDSFIYEFSKGDFEDNFPQPNMQYDFFAEIENDSVIITKNYYLYHIYKDNYLSQFADFHMFLCALYDKEVVIKREYLGNYTFGRDNVLFKKEDKYDDIDISELLDKYFDESLYLNIDTCISNDNLFSLLYRFFSNEYYISPAGYIGLYSISKHDNN